MSAAVHARRQPQPAAYAQEGASGVQAHAPRHVVPPQSTSRLTVPYRSSATRSTNQNNGNGASSSRSAANASYKIEVDQRTAREVIVISDSPETYSAESREEGRAPVASSSKRRKPNQTNGDSAAYDPGYVSAKAPINGHTQVGKTQSDRKVAPSGVGGKRKQDGTSKSSSRKDAHVQQACDDKEGHFIVRSGETLNNGRFRIEQLLGQGTFGKVVEAFDNDTQEYVAVKIIRSIQKYRDASRVEIKVLQTLREADPRNKNNCIHMLYHFDDRNHICIVTELLSTSVFDFLKDNDYAPFPCSHIQDFARQLLGSVCFLHELNLVHTDLKPENILLVASEFRNVPCKRATLKSKRVLDKSNIRLIDFGSATFEDEYHASVVSTRHYRAPEIILGLGWSFPCDAWSIGCILVEFYTGEALFQTHDNLEHLAMMEVVFGRMPERYARAAARSKPEYFKGNRLDFPRPDTTRQSRKFVRQMKPLAETIPPTSIVNTRFHDLLQKLLTWDPAQRLTVREALRHPFFALSIADEGTGCE